MSGPFGSSQWMYASGGFYNGVATQSLRLDDGSSAYLSKSFATSNRKTGTYSIWIKRSNLSLSTGANILSGGDATTNDYFWGFTNTDTLQIRNITNNSYNLEVFTQRVFRDTSAWYNIVVVQDTTQSTTNDRLKIYINGVQDTNLTYTTMPSQNADTSLNLAGTHYISKLSYANQAYIDGYIAEVNFIDGTAYDASYFGEFKNGVWIAKEPSVTYGTNGFRLQFNQTGTGSASSSTIGADTSGNDNHFSSSGIVASDCDMPDSPENNWSTMNPLINGYGTNITMSEGNLAGTGTSGQYNNTLGTFLMTSGKWYWEISSADFNNYDMLGIAIETAIQTTDSTPYGQTGVVAYATQGAVYNESASGTGSYTDFLDSEIIGIAVDLDASPRTFKFYNNNTLQGTINLSSNFDDVGILPFFCIGTTDTIKVNFGQDSSFAGLKTAQGNTDDNDLGDFYYTPPSGYLALCTSNLPEPTISPNADTQADDYFNTVLFTGTGSTQSITGVGFQSDWSWFKRRDGAVNHAWYDVIRGGTNALRCNTTAAESQFGDAVVTFETDGFEIAGTNVSGINGSSESIVSWNWKAGGTAVLNEQGSINSNVSANTDAGFSIVSFTGTGANATVGHGLGVAPSMIIFKNRDSAYSWATYNVHIGAGNRLTLEETTASTASSTSFNSTDPTSSVFSVGTNVATNNSGNGIIAYCFAEIEGYSKIGSYNGNSNADGTFVYLGFRPAWVLIRPTGVGQWLIFDSERNVYNPLGARLFAENSDAESDFTYLDFTSNGFKMRYTGAFNTGDIIYMAFAENPFKYANAR